jgi:hypothetical protein
MKFIVELPDDLAAEINPEYLHQIALPKFFERLREDLAHQEYIQKILTTEEGLASFAWGRRPPLVRASYYKRVEEDQEYRGLWNNDPRRPVIMRGALSRIEERYRGSWCIRLADRYLRFIKYTCHDPVLNRDNINELDTRIYCKFGWNRHWHLELTMHHVVPRERGVIPTFGVGEYGGRWISWVYGERCYVQRPLSGYERLQLANRNIREAYKIINRIEKGLLEHGRKQRTQRDSGDNAAQHREPENQDADAVE